MFPDSPFFFAEKNSGAGLITDQVPREIPVLAHSFPPWVGWANKMICPYLLQFENVLVEVILELLVGVVDAELFKTVPLKVFKPEDVEDPNGQALGETERMVITGGPSLRSNLSAGEGLRTRNIKQGALWFFDFWFLFCFGPRCMACKILVPRSGIELVPPAGEARSPVFSFCAGP